MRFGSLFSGIGGLDLGLERAGLGCVWQSEIEEHASLVLQKHWPDVPNLGDITQIEWESVGRVDLICGGYPCQPFSTAGLGLGDADSRYLWPYFASALSVIRPRFALLENVSRHLRLGFDAVLSDLAELGYDATWSVVSACSLGAPHMRRRLFCLAHPPSFRWGGWGSQEQEAQPRESEGSGVESFWTAVRQPEDIGMAHGVPTKVDRCRMKEYGNAVVPQVAEFVGRQIMAVDNLVDVTHT